MTEYQGTTLQVAGDVTADWILAVPSSAFLAEAYQWQHRIATDLSPQPGGAASLASLIAAAATGASVIGPLVAREMLLDPTNARVTRTYSLWEPGPKAIGQRDSAWRMQRFLGVRPAADAPSAEAATVVAPDCLAIDDSGLGFRDTPAAWPTCLTDGPRPREIMLKMAAPLCTGALWDALIARYNDVLTVYASLGDLRRDDANIGQPLSWEQLAGEVAAAISGDSGLSRAARVVVSIGLAGAVMVEQGCATLVFDPLNQESDWERLHPGIPTGLGTCLTAALALEAVKDPGQVSWQGAVIRGMRAGRAAHLIGHVGTEFSPSALGFPIESAVAELSAPPCLSDDTFTVAPIGADPGWQLLATSGDDYGQLARRIVLDGDAEACRGMPVERMGSWTSIDRTEIESVRSLRNIVRQYLNQPGRSRPLSVAVFGPPGSGKSFAVKQMAREWSAGGLRVDVHEFNVAQFATPSALAEALQRVRDSAVQQAVPLVFWDEFDSPFEGRELGWLARFLAPMQDGTFLESGVARPIGPAIFVFAGGTHSTLASFMERAVTVPGSKATDFLSRLRGHIDVLGPNARDDSDRGYVLRRALALRFLLLAKAPQLNTGGALSIEPGVLRAFLEVPKYVHGARSLEAVIDMSALAGRLRYERSALPARHQLALHVDADAFLGPAQR